MSLFLRIWNALRRRIRHARILLSARSSSLDNLKERKGGNILVLCYGNIYRSPFVEKRLSQRLRADRFSVRSGGFFHKSGRPCEPDYIPLAEESGVLLREHRSRKVCMADVEWADIIVIMDRKNWDALRDMGASIEQKIVWIGSFLESGLPEVRDPYGLSESDVRRTLQRLNESTEGIVNALEKQA